MGNRAEDDYRRREHARLNAELAETLERSRAKREAREAEVRRTRLYSFRLAGGRR